MLEHLLINISTGHDNMAAIDFGGKGYFRDRVLFFVKRKIFSSWIVKSPYEINSPLLNTICLSCIAAALLAFRSVTQIPSKRNELNVYWTANIPKSCLYVGRDWNKRSFQTVQLLYNVNVINRSIQRATVYAHWSRSIGHNSITTIHDINSRFTINSKDCSTT